jgi:hypothetical protein
MLGSQKIEDDLQDLLPTFCSLQRHEDAVHILLAVQKALAGHKILNVKFLDLTLRLGGCENLEFVPKAAAQKVNLSVFIPPICLIVRPKAQEGIPSIGEPENDTPGERVCFECVHLIKYRVDSDFWSRSRHWVS